MKINPLAMPCPFCGGKYIDPGGAPFSFYCLDCYASGPVCDSPEQALSAWNSAPLQWHKSPPQKAGFYFFRNSFAIVQVIQYRPGLTQIHEHGEWAGPIPEPKD